MNLCCFCAGLHRKYCPSWPMPYSSSILAQLFYGPEVIWSSILQPFSCKCWMFLELKDGATPLWLLLWKKIRHEIKYWYTKVLYTKKFAGWKRFVFNGCEGVDSSEIIKAWLSLFTRCLITPPKKTCPNMVKGTHSTISEAGTYITLCHKKPIPNWSLKGTCFLSFFSHFL